MPLPTEDQELARRSRGLSAVGAMAKTDGATLSLSTPSRWVWVGVAGTLVCTFVDGTSATLPNVAGSTLLPLAVSAIDSTSTATGVVALL